MDKNTATLDFELYFDPITEEWRAVERPCLCADPENCTVPVKGCRKPHHQDTRK